MADNTTRSKALLVPSLIAFSMGQSVLFALAGPVARDIGLSEFQVGVIVASAALVFVIASPIWGRISDRWGRKRTIVFGLTSYGVVSFLFALGLRAGLDGLTTVTGTFLILVVLRMTYAILGGGIQPAATGFMADISNENSRSAAVALIGAAFGIGAILGPATASLLVNFGLLTPLYAIALFGILMAGVCAIYLEEPKERHVEAQSGDKFSIQAILPLLIVALCLFSVFAVLQQTVAFYIQDFLSVDSLTAARMTGYGFMSLAFASLIVQGGLIQIFKPKPETLLLAGFPVFALGLALYAFPLHFWHILLAMALMGVGFGVLNPAISSAVSLRIGEENQGRAAGFVQSAASMGFIIGPLLGTGLYQISAGHTIAFAVVLLMIGFLVSLLGVSRGGTLGRKLGVDPSKMVD